MDNFSVLLGLVHQFFCLKDRGLAVEMVLHDVLDLLIASFDDHLVLADCDVFGFVGGLDAVVDRHAVS